MTRPDRVAVPEGLQNGDQFHLLLVTGNSRNATSGDIRSHRWQSAGLTG